MHGRAPVLMWFRRDLRLHDHPALTAALGRGRPVIPVFIHDECVESLGAAPKWRLGLSVEYLQTRLAQLGARLILRRGRAAAVLGTLAEESGAAELFWTKAHDGAAKRRDEEVRAMLGRLGVAVRELPGNLLFEPETVTKPDGGGYRVFTPMWRAIRGRDPGMPLPAPGGWPVAGNRLRSDRIGDWRMGAGMGRGARIVRPWQSIGEDAARERLERFVAERMGGYAEGRDYPGRAATSGLSASLSLGEIGPRTVWHAAKHAGTRARDGAEAFLRELAWREFAYQLLDRMPDMERRNWRPEWDSFPWRGENGDALAWRRGMTGVDFVDAGMREMYVTGTMHNRLRMVVASYLTKNLLTHWRVGMTWFAECLADWDPAANALGWQWVAGSGPDAAPYFRVFNPDRQAKRFDPDGAYRRAWLAEGQSRAPDTALAYFDAAPREWGLSPDSLRPGPSPDPAEGRRRALAAYGRWKG